MNVTTYDYEIPAFYMPYLFNGDDSGLTVKETLAIEGFIDAETKGLTHWHFSSETQDGFLSHWHDLRAYGILPCKCHDVQIVVME